MLSHISTSVQCRWSKISCKSIQLTSSLQLTNGNNGFAFSLCICILFKLSPIKSGPKIWNPFSLASIWTVQQRTCQSTSQMQVIIINFNCDSIISNWNTIELNNFKTIDHQFDDEDDMTKIESDINLSSK